MRAADEIEQRVRTLVASRFGAQHAHFDGQAGLMAELGADSLDMVELIMEIENDFDIDVPDEDAMQITSLRQLIDYVAFAAAAKDVGKRRRVAS